MAGVCCGPADINAAVICALINQLPIAEVPGTLVFSVTDGVCSLAPGGGGGGGGAAQAVYSMQDNIQVETGLARLYAEYDMTVTKIRVSFGIAPTGSAATVVVRINGGIIGTVVVAAGAFTAFITLSAVFITGDYMTVSVTTIGSINPGDDMTVQVSFG